MKNLFIPFTFVLLVAACAPRDVANNENGNGGFGPKGGGGSENAKIAFVVEGDGERAETCPTKNQDYKNVIVSEDDLPGVLDGTVRAVIEPGNRNCFRVGSTVEIKTDFSSSEVQGEAIVVKTEGIAISKLSKKHADAFGLSVSELKARGQSLIDAIEAQKKFRPEGMVNITFISLSGSADNVDVVAEALSTEVYLKAGERPLSCSEKSKSWTRISIPAEQDENVKSGKVIAWYSAGDKNCFEVGATIQIQEKDGPVRAELIVTRIEVVPAAQLSLIHAMAMGQSLEGLKILVNQNETLINVIFFEYVAPPIAPVSPAVATP